jgi:hypothetical protein
MHVVVFTMLSDISAEGMVEFRNRHTFFYVFIDDSSYIIVISARGRR